MMTAPVAESARRTMLDPITPPDEVIDQRKRQLDRADAAATERSRSVNASAGHNDSAVPSHRQPHEPRTADEIKPPQRRFANRPRLPPRPIPAGRRYITQPYTQLASVYRAIGQDEQANTVLVARAERIGELAPAFSAQGLWYRYLGRLIGYGYEPFRAIKIGLVIIVVGALVFAIGAHRNLMAETKLAEHVLVAAKANRESFRPPIRGSTRWSTRSTSSCRLSISTRCATGYRAKSTASRARAAIA